MSILIKGMKMPKNCNDCNFQAGGWCFARSSEPYFSDWCVSDVSERPPWCPLVELPPHGRLIDADVLTTVTEMVNGKWKTYIEVFEVEDAPTVIESEYEK